MAASNDQVTKEELGAALDFTIAILEIVREAVRGAECREGHVVFPAPRKVLDRFRQLAVGGKDGGCSC